jgi:hypothetical protein
MLVFLLGAGLAADPPSLGSLAIVRAGPGTFIEGVQILDMMTITPGEILETRGREFASIFLQGTSLRVMGLSRIRYGAAFAELISGQASVTTTSKFRIRSGCYEVEPMLLGNTEFDVVPYQGRIYVSANNGDVQIRARRKFRVPNGRTAAITGCGTAAEKIELAGTSAAPKIIYGGTSLAGGATTLMMLGNASAESPVDQVKR